jgi:hypothetical protein
MSSRQSLLVVAALAGACGGPAAVQPRPLSYHLESSYLDSVDPAKKDAVLASKNEHEMAIMQRDKIKSDLGQLDLRVLEAQNEAKAAALALDTARAQEKAATASADLNRQGEATAALKKATVGKELADARVDYITTLQKAQHKELRAAEFQVYAAEAKLELEKAGVAVNNSIAPKGFKYDDYDKQHKQRVAEATQARIEADRAANDVLAKKRVLDVKEQALAGDGG